MGPAGNRATIHPTTPTFDQNGALVIGTGNKGKLYGSSNPIPTLLARASQQVTAFHKDSRAPVLRHANPGKVFRLTSDARRGDVPVPRRADDLTWAVSGGAPHQATTALSCLRSGNRNPR